MGGEDVETACEDNSLRNLVIKRNKEVHPQRMRDQGWDVFRCEVLECV